MASWDSTRVKAQLRLTAQRLGQLQSKKDSEGQITRRDIATLLSQSNVALARAKAQKLIREEAMSDVLETLEMHVGTILEHFGELEHSESPSPPVVEAASSIIFAAPQTESKDLQVARDILAQRLGVDFVRSAEGNRDNYVSTRTIRGLDVTPASAASLDEFMYGVARANGVQWRPALRPREKLNALSEILDPESNSPIVDLPRLRGLAASGIPSHPPWLRPRVWRLFLGTLPVLRSSWEAESRKQRDSYYDLVRRLLEPLSTLPTPTTPLSNVDENVLNVYQQLARVPQNLFADLQEEREPTSPKCPLDDKASPDVRIACAGNLDERLKTVQGGNHTMAAPTTPEIRLEITPEIRLESEPSVPEISLTEPTSPTKKAFAAKRPGAPTTLLHSKIITASGTKPRHASALLRVLYIHSCLNPANRSPYVASLLVPLYSVLVQEIESEDAAHVEADTFWAFESMISEFVDLIDEESGNVWIQKFGQRVAWADDELYASLRAKGLDPSLPHYSYRWIAPLLAHTLPLPSMYPIWDALLSRASSTRDSNPKAEHLLDICTSMLVRAKGPLFTLGKPGARSPSLWSEENVAAPPPSPLRPWEANDAFLEGMSLLQHYPIDAAGGVDGILQTASDLLERREAEASVKPNLGLSARLRDTVWRGFTNQPASPLPEEDEPLRTPVLPAPSDKPQPPSEASSSGWRTRLSETVWKGITNQSAMEAPPSPTSPLSPSPSPPVSPLPGTSRLPSRREASDSLHPSSAASPVVQGPSIWGYATKLKDSDTAAQLAKVSSNWTAKAMDAWVKKPVAPTSPATLSEPSPSIPSASSVTGFFKRSSVSSNGSQDSGRHSRQDSLMSASSDPYSPPPRPAYFRPPRDSMMPQPRRESSTSSPLMTPEPEVSPATPESGLVGRAKHLQDSLASLTGSIGAAVVAPQPKSAPRPLLLGGNRTPITGHSPSRSISRTATPTSNHQRQYSELGHERSPHRDSQSSASSSLAPSDAWRASSKTEWDSDGGLIPSKVVPLRRSVSPMAPGFRMTSGRTDSISSTGSSGPRDSMFSYKRDSSQSAPRYPRIDTVASPTASSPPLDTPVSTGSAPAVGEYTKRIGVTLTDQPISLESAEIPDKLTRKRAPPRVNVNVGDTSDSASGISPTAHSPRVKSKRQTRPPNLRIEKESLPAISSQDTLKPHWPEMPEETDATLTPRAVNFDDESSPSPPPSAGAQLSSSVTIKRTRKVSARSNSGDSRTRKVSGSERRVRKTSTEGRERRLPRDSEAEQGDDEGYDDLLSAYESEDAAKA